jgi:hypothetical protein
MSESVEKAPVAWQPLTPRGIAAFACAPLRRLLLVQFIVALMAAASVVWFLHHAWFPTIGVAIRQLPPQGELRSGRLEWQGSTPSRLAEGRFLALVVDPDHGGEARSPAHVQVEFGRTDCKVFSLFGYVQAAYPPSWVVAFNRSELQPWWGAWAPPILAIVAGMVVMSLMLTWACLATLYFLPAWLVGFFGNRELSLCGSWRLAGAALMPGALLLCGTIFLYGWGALDVVRLAVAAAVHLIMGWVYLFVSLLRLPRQPVATAEGNPFA